MPRRRKTIRQAPVAAAATAIAAPVQPVPQPAPLPSPPAVLAVTQPAISSRLMNLLSRWLAVNTAMLCELEDLQPALAQDLVTVGDEVRLRVSDLLDGIGVGLSQARDTYLDGSGLVSDAGEG